jgi:hypothetical protein
MWSSGRSKLLLLLSAKSTAGLLTRTRKKSGSGFDYIMERLFVMSKMISIQFTYRNSTHHALVRCGQIEGLSQIRVTVMNGDVEALLFGHHIFFSNEGKITPALQCANQAVTEIQQAIIESLSCSGEFFELYTHEVPATGKQQGNPQI